MHVSLTEGDRIFFLLCLTAKKDFLASLSVNEIWVLKYSPLSHRVTISLSNVRSWSSWVAEHALKSYFFTLFKLGVKWATRKRNAWWCACKWSKDIEGKLLPSLHAPNAQRCASLYQRPLWLPICAAIKQEF